MAVLLELQSRLSGPKQYSILGEGWGWLRKHGSLLLRSTDISLQQFQYTVTLHDEFAASSSLFEYFNNFWSEFQWDDDLEYAKQSGHFLRFIFSYCVYYIGCSVVTNNPVVSHVYFQKRYTCLLDVEDMLEMYEATYMKVKVKF
ncbi:hypothetical protein Tco_0834965 [Tanacetum coccineum]